MNPSQSNKKTAITNGREVCKKSCCRRLALLQLKKKRQMRQHLQGIMIDRRFVVPKHHLMHKKHGVMLQKSERCSKKNEGINSMSTLFPECNGGPVSILHDTLQSAETSSL
jgi:hypothetical protein